MTPDRIFEQLGLRPHPEGGHFVETWRERSADGSRGALTCIHFLLCAGEVSAWHRIDATEIWHFAAGAPLELCLSPEGEGTHVGRLGPNVLAGERPHVVVPPGCSQSARDARRLDAGQLHRGAGVRVFWFRARPARLAATVNTLVSIDVVFTICWRSPLDFQSLTASYGFSTITVRCFMNRTEP